MGNKYLYCNIFLMLLLIITETGCNQEENLTGRRMNDKMGLTVQLNTPLRLETDTRAVTAELGISDVWVIQCTTTDSKIVVKNYADTDVSWDNTSGRYKVTTEATDFWNENSKFYVIANAGSEHAGLKELKSKAEAATPTAVIENDLLPLLKELSGGAVTTEPGLLSDGPINFEGQTGGAPQTKAALVCHLKRAYVRVRIAYEVGSADFPNASFTPTGLTITNLPKNMAFYERAGAVNGNYPSVTADSHTDYNTATVTFPFTFYMAGNLRGTGISTTAQGKNMAVNGPLEDSSGGSGTRSLKGCTGIVLTGKYKYDKDHSGEVEVVYTFYLGGNLVNDYNIERGKAYSLNITIGSVNSADLRVIVTDGNVSVFEQVTVIPEINVDM